MESPFGVIAGAWWSAVDPCEGVICGVPSEWLGHGAPDSASERIGLRAFLFSLSFDSLKFLQHFFKVFYARTGSRRLYGPVRRNLSEHQSKVVFDGQDLFFGQGLWILDFHETLEPIAELLRVHLPPPGMAASPCGTTGEVSSFFSSSVCSRMTRLIPEWTYSLRMSPWYLRIFGCCQSRCPVDGLKASTTTALWVGTGMICTLVVMALLSNYPGLGPYEYIPILSWFPTYG